MTFTHRGLLAFSQVDTFAAWAVAQGFRRETTKGKYEVLRLSRSGISPLIWYRTERAKVHATTPADPQAQRLLRAFFASRKDSNERRNSD